MSADRVSSGQARRGEAVFVRRMPSAPLFSELTRTIHFVASL